MTPFDLTPKPGAPIKPTAAVGVNDPRTAWIGERQQSVAAGNAAAKAARTAAAGGPPAAPGAAGAAPGAPAPNPQSVIGNAPPWLNTQEVAGYNGGAGITLTNPSLDGLPAIDTDFSGAAERGAEAAYKGATQFFDEDFGVDRAGLENKLINQGFAPGSEAFEREMGLMLRSQNATRENAAYVAQGVGHQQSGDMLMRALTSRQALLGERTDIADRLFGQSMGVAELGLGARGQDRGLEGTKTAAHSAAGSSRYATDAGLRGKELDASLDLRRLGLSEDEMDFNQMMALTGSARGGVNMPNFGPPQPLDVGGAYGIANANANAAAGRAASDRAGLYGLGAAALGALARNGYG